MTIALIVVGVVLLGVFSIVWIYVAARVAARAVLRTLREVWRDRIQ